ncbi:B3 domain-containing protein Os01g0234100-like isoform X1 [Rhododendron vialii]|uniref:B3 domain-containing protein Os01g0234100-like isoform X1 n=1 Tax=Rhododendron vialii TaxID=182163 RepID=UPI00265DA118|nr:B3 domain-containing protein Os01g0234100-like isoform X1 [Rhododendron vialii]
MGKVKFCKQSESTMDLDTPSNSHSDSDDQVGEEIVFIKQVQSNELPTSEDHSPKSAKPNFIQLSPSTPSPSSTVKGKKNSWDLHEELNWQLGKTKKKRSGSKSKHAVSNHAGKPMSCKQSKSAMIGLPVEVKTPAMIRAEEIKSSLGCEFPSFVKPLVRSNVSSCFWMGLSGPFSKSHLPEKDTSVILEDESGEQFQVKYIQGRWGLSGGWRSFAMGHKLLEGDVLIFQLVEPNKMKVYIVRANGLTEVDGALSLLNLDAHVKQDDTEKDDADDGTIALDNKKRKRPISLQLAIVKKNKKASLQKSVPKLTESVVQLENGCEEVGSEPLIGPRFSSSTIRIWDVKSFKHFNILVDGLSIDSEIPKHIRVKYFNLCQSRRAFLHARLFHGLNIKLVSGIISEIVNIADAIRACTLTTSRNKFEVWEKSLKSFELVGMNVGFLSARLRRLLSLAIKTEVDVDVKKYVEAKTRKVQADDEIRKLKAKVVELKVASRKLGAFIKALKSKVEGYEHKFQEEVDAPW